MPQPTVAQSAPEALTAPGRTATPPRPARMRGTAAGVLVSNILGRGERSTAPSIEQVKEALVSHFQAKNSAEAADFIPIIMEEQNLSHLLEVAKDEGVSVSPKPTKRTRKMRRQPPSLHGLGFTNGVKRAPPALPESPEARSRLEATFADAAMGGAVGGVASTELTTSQVKAFFSSVGMDVDDDWVQQCVDTYDADNSGAISLDEFALLVGQLAPQKLGEESKGRFSGFSSRRLLKATDKWNEIKQKHGPATELPRNLKDFRAMSRAKQVTAVVGFGGWCVTLFLFALQIMVILLEEECVELPPITACNDHFDVSFGTDVPPAVDILVVVDTSSSMTPLANIGIQNNLMAYIESLASNSSSIEDRWRLIVANSQDGCHNNAGKNCFPVFYSLSLAEYCRG